MSDIKKEELMRGLTDSQVSESKSKYGSKKNTKNIKSEVVKI